MKIVVLDGYTLNPWTRWRRWHLTVYDRTNPEDAREPGRRS
ncbi:MAG: hypothetical protein ACLSHC_10635 [Bilophila wadsworthia]